MLQWGSMLCWDEGSETAMRVLLAYRSSWYGQGRVFDALRSESCLVFYWRGTCLGSEVGSRVQHHHQDLCGVVDWLDEGPEYQSSLHGRICFESG